MKTGVRSKKGKEGLFLGNGVCGMQKNKGEIFFGIFKSKRSIFYELRGRERPEADINTQA